MQISAFGYFKISYFGYFEIVHFLLDGYMAALKKVTFDYFEIGYFLNRWFWRL